MRLVTTVIACLLCGFFVNGCCDVASKRDEARARACLANMRVMAGSIEIYNVDHSEMLKKPDFSMFLEGGVMIKENLLKQPIRLPDDQCSYSFIGDFSDPDTAVISCSAHGSVKDIDEKYSR